MAALLGSNALGLPADAVLVAILVAWTFFDG
jgi:hypothetical protein